MRGSFLRFEKVGADKNEVICVRRIVSLAGSLLPLARFSLFSKDKLSLLVVVKRSALCLAHHESGG